MDVMTRDKIFSVADQIGRDCRVLQDHAKIMAKKARENNQPETATSYSTDDRNLERIIDVTYALTDDIHKDKISMSTTTLLTHTIEYAVRSLRRIPEKPTLQADIISGLQRLDRLFVGLDQELHPMYRAVLDLEETSNFMKLFYELEVGRMSAVTVHPIIKDSRLQVTLLPTLACRILLDASMTDGMLMQEGWSKYFKKLSQ